LTPLSIYYGDESRNLGALKKDQPIKIQISERIGERDSNNESKFRKREDGSLDIKVRKSSIAITLPQI
jgi:hypothetical protein